MSRPDNLPPTARAIALLLSSTPSVQDVQPAVLHQLLDFSHRYTAHVLTDANVYAEYAGRAGKIEMDDVVLAVQARVGWEFGGRVPKEYILSLASDVNAVALPAVPEVFGVRMPQASECLTSIDFDLIPNKPPPGVKLYDEEIEEVEESESEDDDDLEPAPIPSQQQSVPAARPAANPAPQEPPREFEEAPFPISAIDTSADLRIGSQMAVDEGSDAGEEEDGLFAGGDEEEEDSDAMEEVQTTLEHNGVKRKLEEDDDYD
ncbi:transcription initiation factor IID, 31kD subunit-domain-containing protein [Mycena albidolilacea]|uniref:Transcription initiation factor IID, 31kD subunit-domain-containing protein n=1 Tax=Mycena albidolilacea TaxID=1033008 RepID=A0AAD7F6V5_9AGAR|nr:transcription initiation factor IID, 31kD subunit-domain-containing protein [Mycena albidolilacea]